MANTLIQFRVEEETRVEALKILNQLGMDLPAYLKMCMRQLIQEQAIPFSMKLPINENDPGIILLRELGEEAKRNGISEMTLEEINAEIAAARRERHERLEKEKLNKK